MKDQWNDAARKAADELESKVDKLLMSLCETLKTVGVMPKNVCVDTYNKDAADTIRYFSEIIAKHHADLKATHNKLVELAVWCEREVDYADQSTDYESFKKIIDDPLVVAAIERSNG